MTILPLDVRWAGCDRVGSMSTRLRDVLMAELSTLRYEPTQKRIRATLEGETVIDSRRALLVWEPKRVVPTYAVPVDDVEGEIGAAPADDAAPPPPAIGAPRLGDRVVLDPSDPVRRPHRRGRAAHGPRPRRRARGERPSARPIPRSTATSSLDFDAFDAWYEEDERNVGAPARPVPSHRHRAQLAPRARRARRRDRSRSPPARACCSSRRCRSATTCRAEDVRTDLLRAERHAHLLRLQGRGVLLVAARTRTTSRGPTSSRCARRPR